MRSHCEAARKTTTSKTIKRGKLKSLALEEKTLSGRPLCMSQLGVPPNDKIEDSCGTVGRTGSAKRKL